MTPRHLLALLFVLPACTAAPSGRSASAPPPQAPASSTEQAEHAQDAERTIRQILARQADDWNRHDARAWVAAFSDDAEFINILGMALQGRPEIERRHVEIFQTIFARSRVVVVTRKVRVLGPSAALAETDYELRDYDRLPPGIQATDPDGTLRTRLKYVWELEREGWRIVAAQNTAILPLPPKP